MKLNKDEALSDRDNHSNSKKEHPVEDGYGRDEVAENQLERSFFMSSNQNDSDIPTDQYFDSSPYKRESKSGGEIWHVET